MKMCNIHLGWYWKVSKLNKMHLYNMHYRARFPAGMIPPAPRHRHKRGHTAGTNPLARDDRREPPPKCLYRKSVRCNTRTPHTYHTPSLPAVLVFWKQSRIHHASAMLVLSRSTAPGPRGESVTPCDCSRLSVNGLGPGGGRFKEPMGQY